MIMTKNQLDKDFIKIYSSIDEYATKAIKFFRSNIEKEYLLSEAYIYVEERKMLISNINILESFCKNFIKKSIIWKNSKINRELKKQIPFSDLESISYRYTTTNDPNYDEYLDLLTEFNKNLSPYDKRLFNIWFHLELKTGKKISEYLKISLSLSYRTIKECKEIEERFKNYILIKSIL